MNPIFQVILPLFLFFAFSFAIPPALAVNEICAAGSSACCTPPPVVDPCQGGTVWIGSASGERGCETPKSCPAQQFSCAVNDCVPAPSGSAAKCSNAPLTAYDISSSAVVHVGGNVCRWRVDAYQEAASLYKLWLGQVLQRVVTLPDADCLQGQVPVWDNAGKKWACGQGDSLWKANGTNVSNTNTGNVGIGTTPPDYKLDVAGSISTDDYLFHNGDDNTYLGFSTNDTVKVVTGGAERLTILSNGRTGIGTSPGSMFHVGDGWAKFNWGIIIGNGTAANISPGRYMSQPTSSGSYGYFEAQNSAGQAGAYFGLGNGSDQIELRLNQATKLNISGGNVGIGSSNPTAKLEINMSNTNGWSGNLKAGRVYSPDNGYYMDLITYVIGGGNVGYHFSPNGNTGLVVSTPGNVGIGTTSPAHKLDVNGDIKTSGSLLVGNSVFKPDQGGSIELHGNYGVGSRTPYIDFTEGTSSADYNFRLMATSPYDLSLLGDSGGFTVYPSLHVKHGLFVDGGAIVGEFHNPSNARNNCYWTSKFSEEQPAMYCAGNQYVAGMECFGDDCDDVKLYCCDL